MKNLNVRNPFRDKNMRQAFDDAVRMYETRHKNFFAADGKPHRGNSWAGMFWRGFEGVPLANGTLPAARPWLIQRGARA